MAIRREQLGQPIDRPSISEVLRGLVARREWEGPHLGPSGLRHLVELPERAAVYGELARPLPPALDERLPGPLWSHQARAIDLARAGRSVVVASGTASGKSLCYQLPMSEAASAPIRPGTGLVLFPTKALAHDQLRAFTEARLPGVIVGAYDGDASSEERSWVRKNASVVLTNPEMLHSALLPHHARWATFLGRLHYVVVDELHTFRGVFGSHVAQLLRRLRRLASHHGADPVFIFSSATIGEPQRLASELCGTVVEAVLGDGSPRGPRTVALWQPPLVDEASGARGSAHHESATVMRELIGSGCRTLGFARSRLGVEIVAADLRRQLPAELATEVRAYRGGYLAEERRAIEDDLAAGRLSGVVSTSALELGIDVGGLDAVVVDGFPGTISSFWQQAGRAGRTGAASAAVLVAGNDQLDQWLARNPHELFDRAPEPAVVNPANPYVLDPHLRCAAHELPLTHGDHRWWPGALDDGVRRLVQAGELAVRHRGRHREPLAVWVGSGWPSHGVGLRNAAGSPVRIVTARGDQPVGDVDFARAPQQVHEGASYMHQGRHWSVVELDLDVGVARVEPDDGSTYTVARSTTDVRLLESEDRRGAAAAELHIGSVQVCSRVVSYQRKEALSGALLDTTALDLPSTSLVTRAFWYVFDPALVRGAGVEASRLAGALHAIEHAAIGMLPLFAICDRWDVGGVSTTRQPDTGRPTVVIYDAMPGGAGVAELGFAAADRHLAATFESVSGCGCAEGCPSCVQSPKCGNGNEQLDKAAALDLLGAILGRRSSR